MELKVKTGFSGICVEKYRTRGKGWKEVRDQGGLPQNGSDKSEET
jgi:hypothetical protein